MSGTEPFVAEISVYGFNFEPQGSAFCNGQLLPIAQNTALFSLLGTTYGGNGQTNFQLPDLQGRSGLHVGQGPGLSNYQLGQTGGADNVTLTTAQMPIHTHSMPVSPNAADQQSPSASAYLAKPRDPAYAAANNGTVDMESDVLSVVGTAPQPHENRPPYLGLNFCIALQGIFPSRS